MSEANAKSRKNTVRALDLDRSYDASRPHFGVEETDSHFMVSAELTVSQKNKLKIEVVSNHLFISGTGRNEPAHFLEGAENGGANDGEQFQRIFTFPTRFESDGIEAIYRHGILRISLRKAQSQDRRVVRITD